MDKGQKYGTAYEHTRKSQEVTLLRDIDFLLPY